MGPVTRSYKAGVLRKGSFRLQTAAGSRAIEGARTESERLQSWRIAAEPSAAT